jgi:hypothetical protein
MNPEPSGVLFLTQLQNMDDTCHSDAIAFLCYVENYFIDFLHRMQSLMLIKIQALTGEKYD